MILENKTALVTGAAQGIGLAIAEALLEEGAQVVITDQNNEALTEAQKVLGARANEVTAIQVDVTDETSIRSCLKQVLAKFTRLDILVNNAGICKLSSILEMDLQSWERTFKVNVSGLFLCSKIIAQHMAEDNDYACIINVASNAGKVGFPNQADYNASKAAVINLTRSMAEELAPHNINVNAVCPGAVRTTMLEVIARKIANESGENPKELIKTFAPPQLGRLVEPIEVGRVVAFLASDKARIIRGQAINVDAGSTPY